MPLYRPIAASTHRLLHVECVDSTNAEAMRRAEAGEPGGLWIIADTQTAGRGRSGRRWFSEPGNLTASLLIRLATPAPKAYQLSLVAGVAVTDAISATMSLAPEACVRLKWPNDILIGAAKAGGILVESSMGAAGLVAVIGIGINLVSHPEGLGRAATHLGAHGPAPEPDALLSEIAIAMDRWLERWGEGRDFASVREAWLARAHPIGERLSINTGAEAVEGLFGGIDQEGALLMRDGSGRERRFSFGDVTLAG
jgi:BirA family biotin operon repressor/biotin-[acetyl-CoA-carboxylase] ligase